MPVRSDGSRRASLTIFTSPLGPWVQRLQRPVALYGVPIAWRLSVDSTTPPSCWLERPAPPSPTMDTTENNWEEMHHDNGTCGRNRKDRCGNRWFPLVSEALRWAGRQAELTRSALHVIMTWEWPLTYGWAMPFPAGYDPEEDVRRVLDEAVADLPRTYSSLDITAKVMYGHPAPLLVEASKGADLLVVGSRGHGEFHGDVDRLGERVLRYQRPLSGARSPSRQLRMSGPFPTSDEGDPHGT